MCSNKKCEAGRSPLRSLLEAEAMTVFLGRAAGQEEGGRHSRKERGGRERKMSWSPKQSIGLSHGLEFQSILSTWPGSCQFTSPNLQRAPESKDGLLAPGAYTKWLCVPTVLGRHGVWMVPAVFHAGHACIWKLSGSPSLVLPRGEKTETHRPEPATRLAKSCLPVPYPYPHAFLAALFLS